MKLNIAVLFGHLSCEHDISIITANQAMKNLDTNKYNIIPIYITKDNKYITCDELKSLSYYNQGIKGKEIFFLPNSNFIYKNSVLGLKKYKRIDVALLCFHGHLGEDGAMQGLFELNNIPYTSTSIIGSSCGANKIVFKEILKGLRIPTVKSMWLSDYEFHKDKHKIATNIFHKLGNTVIVKPNSLGSSIGINVCSTELELVSAFKLAFELDNRVLIEEYIKDFREVNIASFFDGEKHIFSDIEEAPHNNKFLSFDEKYLGGNKLKNKESNGQAVYLGGNLKAELDNKQKNQIKLYTKRLYDTLELNGIVRFDYMITNDTIYLNEINTIPGSLANYLFKSNGYTYKELLDKLINSAILNNSKKESYIHTFNSSVLKNTNGIIKK